jgi:glycerophosphoryl diester phosphodiesterase
MRRCLRCSSFSRRHSTPRGTPCSLTRALLVDKLPADWLARLARLECVALDIDHQELDADIVRRVRAAGYRVLCYTPNESERIANLAAWGVDGIITDAVDHVAADSLPPPLPLT